MITIILYQPEIPQNTGNIIRTCVALDASLALVRPLGFLTSSRMLKRAGIDYARKTLFEEIDNLEDYLDKKRLKPYFFSSKAKKSYTDISYPPNTALVFGSETKGLPLKYFEKWEESFVTIPMDPSCRCLNLSNACAIAGYEVRRQWNFS